ncbi:tRNA 2-selenouridine(34) synthase MnmH [Jannaschia donghaensis]|uniref:tRNA 2-selenouridine synthase n=1 Tax=Jannaschia donghaensis TaxID=420998 RepID=A0A0M6YLF3_9RHOB|nr:tRNA 2-selenouridine(34) synthase MnmH [Jannaschia donghaensis]CTQ51192.1 tRNA 2-selenouridine synthase [Jannaschia donghaensis]
MDFTLPDLRLTDLPFDDIVDVRSPSEFAEDHVPGAINLPAMSDAERAQVGTIYVREDRFKARRIGAALVSRNVAAHLEGPLADRDGSWRPLVYCWRGGQRSGSVATIFDQIGWRVGRLTGGYKAYRKMVSDRLYQDALGLRIVLIDGGTGHGKTQLLDHLAAAGAQIVNLEGLANHRGSNFGGWANGQPSQKMFESRLAQAFGAQDPARPVFVESESNAIGRVLLPPALWSVMGTAEVIGLRAPLTARAQFLMTTYPDLTADADLLRQRIETLRNYQPGQRIADWHGLAEAGEYVALAGELIEHHYDPRYRRPEGSMRRDIGVVEMTSVDDAALAQAADRVIALAG